MRCDSRWCGDSPAGQSGFGSARRIGTSSTDDKRPAARLDESDVDRFGTSRSLVAFLHGGRCRALCFSPEDIPALLNVATVISADGPLTARFIVTELEKRGVGHLLVEGGAHVLRMFLDERMADEVRMAVNPALTLGDAGYAVLTSDRRRMLLVIVKI